MEEKKGSSFFPQDPTVTSSLYWGSFLSDAPGTSFSWGREGSEKFAAETAGISPVRVELEEKQTIFPKTSTTHPPVAPVPESKTQSQGVQESSVIEQQEVVPSEQEPVRKASAVQELPPEEEEIMKATEEIPSQTWWDRLKITWNKYWKAILVVLAFITLVFVIIGFAVKSSPQVKPLEKFNFSSNIKVYENAQFDPFFSMEENTITFGPKGFNGGDISNFCFVIDGPAIYTINVPFNASQYEKTTVTLTEIALVDYCCVYLDDKVVTAFPTRSATDLSLSKNIAAPFIIEYFNQVGRKDIILSGKSYVGTTVYPLDIVLANIDISPGAERHTISFKYATIGAGAIYFKLSFSRTT